jgi:hypothetical protein
MKTCPLLLLGFFTLISCIPFDLPNLGTDTVEKGEYDIHIYGPNTNTRLVGKHVDTQWIPEDGWIFMNTDEVDTLNPIGTITLQLGAFDDASPHSYPYIVDSLGNPFVFESNEWEVNVASVSKTEIRKGTAAQLDAKLFESKAFGGSIYHVELGANFIRGYLFIRMDRVKTNPNDPNFVEEVVLVSGEFTAMSR